MRSTHPVGGGELIIEYEGRGRLMLLKDASH